MSDWRQYLKRINGSKVCKDGVEVLWLLPNINTRWVCGGETSVGQQKLLSLQKIKVNVLEPNSGWDLSVFYQNLRLFWIMFSEAEYRL